MAQPEPAVGRRSITPVARRIADAMRLDLSALGGTGPGGRITKRDVLAFRAGAGAIAASAAEAVSAASPPRIAHVAPQDAPPHALTAMLVDLGTASAACDRRRAEFARRGLDLTPTACIALVAVAALARHPLLNAAWSDMGIVVRRRVHLAVVLPAGASAPVVRDAQDLNLRGMARAVSDIMQSAHVDVPRPGQAEQATFTISCQPAGALWSSVPALSPHQSASLGIGAVRLRPLVADANGAERVVVHPTAVLTLAYDARVLDQSAADAFLRDLQVQLARFQA